MTITVVQTAISAANSPTAVFGAAVTPGNTVVIANNAVDNTGGVTIVPNTPTLGGSAPSGSAIKRHVQSSLNQFSAYAGLWVMPAIASPAGDKETVSLTLAAGNIVSVIAFEVAGLGSSPAADIAVLASGLDGSGSVALTSGASAQAPELVAVSAIQYGTALGNPGSPWTLDQTSNQHGSAGYQVATSTGTFVWDQSGVNDDEWAVVMVSLFAGASVSPSGLPLAGII